MRHAGVLLLVVLLVPLLPAAPAAPPGDEAPSAPPDAVQRHEGALVLGGPFGLHVADRVPWRADHPLRVPPGAREVVATLDAADALDGKGVRLVLVGPDGEAVTQSPTGTTKRTMRMGWDVLSEQGFGDYVLRVECTACSVLTYALELRTRFVAEGANLTLDERHVLAVPGRATGLAATVRNTGAAPAAFALEAAGLPDGWTLAPQPTPALAPGEAAEATLWLEAPGALAPGTRVPFDLVARAASGEVLDRARVEAAYTEDLARMRAASHVVVALVEFGGSGINPYHEEFRGAFASREHPDGYLDGYPHDAAPLPLTLDAASYDEAFAADAATWAGVRGSTLYYVPGTRIVGFICFGACTALDEGGHGTGTASLAAGTTTGEDPDALVVSVTGDFFAGARWAARQPWIDVISMSLGPWVGTCTVGVCDPGAGTGNAYVPFSMPVAHKLAYESGKRFFAASSQGWSAGASGVGGASGPCPYTMGNPMAGTPWAFAVETYWPWTELPWRTSCTPDVVAQGWDLVAASPRSLDGHNSFGHPSGATPQAAGAYALVLHEGRRALGCAGEGARPLLLADAVEAPRALGDGVVCEAAPGTPLPPRGPLADGVLTVREAERVFLHALEQVDVATSFLRHGSDPRWARDAAPVPPGGEFASEGYGLLTPRARSLMLDVLRGEAPEPVRADDDAAYAAHRAARLALWEPHVQAGLWVF